jgi:N-acetylmuramoyl-L-alanine amidase
LLIIRRALLALAVVFATLWGTVAHASEWKMDTLLKQVTISHELRELEDNERREALCMALAIYHEARGEPRRGQVAVAWVVLNRQRAGSFPQSICAVVWQKSQFSWTKRPVGSLVPRSAGAWAQSQDVARKVMQGERADPTDGADHFHGRQIRPRWAGRSKASLLIGKHLFHRLY